MCTNIWDISLDHICNVKANRIVDDKLVVVPVELQAVFVKQKIALTSAFYIKGKSVPLQT